MNAGAVPKPAKDDFDIALIEGARCAVQDVYRQLRQAEELFYAGTLATVGTGTAFMDRVCPLCAADACLPFMEARGLRIVRCASCAHVYSRNVYRPDLDARMYNMAGADMWPAYLKMKAHPLLAKVERLRNHYYLNACERYSTIGRLLDIGSGNGSLLCQAVERGWQVLGLDPNPVWQGVTPDLGIKPRLGSFPGDLAAGERFEAIAMLDVLEHMVDPAGFLASSRPHLAAGGIVFVQVPNLNSLLLRLEGSANNNFCPGHWSHFDADALSRLADACGFETLWTETVISELDRVLAFAPEQVAAAASSLAKASLRKAADLTPAWMHRHLLGYKLVSILRVKAGR